MFADHYLVEREVLGCLHVERVLVLGGFKIKCEREKETELHLHISRLEWMREKESNQNGVFERSMRIRKEPVFVTGRY